MLHEDRRDDDDARQRRVALPGQEAVLPGSRVVVERGIDLRGLLVFLRGLLVVFEVIAARPPDPVALVAVVVALHAPEESPEGVDPLDPHKLREQ